MYFKRYVLLPHVGFEPLSGAVARCFDYITCAYCSSSSISDAMASDFESQFLYMYMMKKLQRTMNNCANSNNQRLVRMNYRSSFICCWNPGLLE